MLWVGGFVAVLPLSVVLATLLVRVLPAPGVGAACDADGEGVVGDALVDGGVVTVPWGLDHATPGRGSRGRCWPVCWPWRRWPCLVSGPSFVSLMPLVLLALYRVVSPWWLLLTLRVAVAVVALLVVLLVMPVARALQALLRFTASLLLLMLLVVGVGPRVRGQWLVFGAGLLLFPGGRWPVPWALRGTVCVGDGVAGVAPGDVVGEGGDGGAAGVGAGGDGVVDGVLCDALLARCCCLLLRALVSSGEGLVVCWFTGCGGVACLWCRRLPVAKLMVG